MRFILVCVLLAGTAAPASAAFVDQFRDGAFRETLEAGSDPIFLEQTGRGESILGGVRSVALKVSQGSGALDAGIDTASGLSLKGRDGAAGSIVLSYGERDTLTAGLLTGWDAIAIDLAWMSGPWWVALTIRDDEQSRTLQRRVTETGTLRLLLNDPSFNGIDINEVRRVSLRFAGETDEALTLGSIAFAVPAPGALPAMIGMALLGARRRRR